VSGYLNVSVCLPLSLPFPPYESTRLRLLLPPQITFQKRPATTELAKPRAPLNLITMAEGTPNDAAIGFAPNWRANTPFAALDISSLPWHGLLAHLPSTVDAAAAAVAPAAATEESSNGELRGAEIVGNI
jgi:hypothetical protein